MHNIDESQRYYVKYKKLVSKGYILMIPFIWTSGKDQTRKMEDTLILAWG